MLVHRKRYLESKTYANTSHAEWILVSLLLHALLQLVRRCHKSSPIPVSVLICGSNICFAITSLLATSIVADEMEVEII